MAFFRVYLVIILKSLIPINGIVHGDSLQRIFVFVKTTSTFKYDQSTLIQLKLYSSNNSKVFPVVERAHPNQELLQGPCLDQVSPRNKYDNDCSQIYATVLEKKAIYGVAKEQRPIMIIYYVTQWKRNVSPLELNDAMYYFPKRIVTTNQFDLQKQFILNYPINFENCHSFNKKLFTKINAAPSLNNDQN